MPRTPKPPTDFIIESISTGEREHSIGAGLSDFNGQPITRPALASVKPKPTLTPLEIHMLHRQKHDAELMKEHLKRVRLAKSVQKIMRDMIDPPKHKPFKRRF